MTRYIWYIYGRSYETKNAGIPCAECGEALANESRNRYEITGDEVTSRETSEFICAHHHEESSWGKTGLVKEPIHCVVCNRLFEYGDSARFFKAGKDYLPECREHIWEGRVSKESKMDNRLFVARLCYG